MSKCLRAANQHRCLPLSAIIPPASLTAEVFHSTQFETDNMPSVRWDQVYMEYPTGSPEFKDASQDSYRIASAVMYGGRVLPMTPSHQNYSYVLNFPGPRLRCKDVEDEDAFSKQIQVDHFNSHMIPYYNATMSPIDMMLWISTPSRNFTCQTWNVTYTTTFSFTNGVQDAQINDIRYDHVVVKEIPEKSYNHPSPYNLGYQGWFTALASLLGGNITNIATHGRLYSVGTKILQSSLSGCPELRNASKQAQRFGETCPEQDLVQGIEALSANITLSYLASIPDM